MLLILYIYLSVCVHANDLKNTTSHHCVHADVTSCVYTLFDCIFITVLCSSFCEINCILFCEPFHEINLVIFDWRVLHIGLSRVSRRYCLFLFTSHPSVQGVRLLATLVTARWLVAGGKSFFS